MTDAEIATKYEKLAEMRENGDYLVIVARIENGRVVFTRPGMTCCGPGPMPRGQRLADLQLRSGLTAVDRSALRGADGESLTRFLERFK